MVVRHRTLHPGGLNELYFHKDFSKSASAVTVAIFFFLYELSKVLMKKEYSRNASQLKFLCTNLNFRLQEYQH